MDRQLYTGNLEKLKLIQEDRHHALRIAVCGKFKSGKTSLLNLMLGTSLPVQSVTATGIVTKIIYGDSAAVKMKNGDLKSVSREEQYDYISVVDKNLDGVTTGDAKCAYIGCRSKLLKRGRVEFWDTPGLEDDPSLTQITLEAVHRCDLLIYVMHAGQALSQYEKRLFPKLHRLMNGNIIFVVNHMDSLRGDEANNIIMTVGSALGNYKNRLMPKGNLFFTSAGPEHPYISSLADSIAGLCGDKETRINLLNSAKCGKFSILEEEWKEYIAEDTEDAKKRIGEFRELIREDIERKKKEIKDTYIRCETSCRRIQKNLEGAVTNESAWRMVLADYQKISGWETDFVYESAERIKGRMDQLIRQGNEDIRNAVRGSLFEEGIGEIELDERVVWKKADWYKNFSRPLLFAETKFRQYRIDCVEKCIGALMAGPVVIVEDRISGFFSVFFSRMEQRCQSATAEVAGAPELLKGLDQANAELAFITECQNSIDEIGSDIRRAVARNRLSYKVRDTFPFLFAGMMADEIYNE